MQALPQPNQQTTKRIVTVIREPDDRTGSHSNDITGLKNFTLLYSKKNINPVTFLNNSASKSKTSLEFKHLAVEKGICSSSVFIDGLLIATGTGESKKQAKHKCANTALEILKERQVIVDKSKKSDTVKTKKSKPKPTLKGEVQKKLPLLIKVAETVQSSGDGQISTDGSIGTQSNFNTTASTVPTGLKRQNSDMAVGSKKKKIKGNPTKKLFVKENTSVENEQPATSGATNSNPYPEIPEGNIGHQLLKKMGWTGGGLGRQGDGRKEPVMHSLVRGRQGLGLEVKKKVIKKRSSAASKRIVTIEKHATKDKQLVNTKLLPPVTRSKQVNLGISKILADLKINPTNNTVPKTRKVIEVIDVDRAAVVSSFKKVIDVDNPPSVTKPSNVMINIHHQVHHNSQGRVIRTASKEGYEDNAISNTVRDFLKSSEKELRVSNHYELARQSRINLFKLCDAHGLQFQSFIKGKKRSIIISKPED